MVMMMMTIIDFQDDRPVYAISLGHMVKRVVFLLFILKTPG
jgi:hypothetical protein